MIFHIFFLLSCGRAAVIAEIDYGFIILYIILLVKGFYVFFAQK